MATQVSNVSKIKSGMCPHGLPPSACPICSNMGGGSMRVGERAQKAGEMSYHECAMIGNMIRARKLAQKQHLQQLEQNKEIAKQFETTMIKLSTNLKSFIARIPNNLLTKPVILVAKVLILPIANLLQVIPKTVQKLQNFKFDIQDKLNAIFGEIKNFIQRKVSELIINIKNKSKNLFKIFKKNNTEDEDTKIDDDKKIFNLKTILHKILRKKKTKR